MKSLFLTPFILSVFILLFFPFNTPESSAETVDISATVPGCGDGIMSSGEECDGTDFGGATCISSGFVSGTLSCSSSCNLFTTSCSFVEEEDDARRDRSGSSVNSAEEQSFVEEVVDTVYDFFTDVFDFGSNPESEPETEPESPLFDVISDPGPLSTQNETKKSIATFVPIVLGVELIGMMFVYRAWRLLRIRKMLRLIAKAKKNKL
jgi:hypothetical protein